MRNLYLIAGLLFVTQFTAAQTFENVRATAQGDRVIITYDLIAQNPDQTFEVAVYASHNNYQTPIQKVIGDVGPAVKAGAKKTVAWNVADELTSYRGDITFELRGKLVVMRFSFRSPVVGASVRRGKKTEIEWLGGTPMQEVQLSLYQGDRFVGEVAKTLNAGKYEWRIPSDLDKGEGYFLRLSAGGEMVESGTFRIKAKVPAFLKLSPLLVAGGALLFLSPDPSPQPGREELPVAPDPN